MDNTFSDHLVAFLLSGRSTRIYRRVLWERLHTSQRNLRKSTFDQYLSRLNNKKFIYLQDEQILVNKGKIHRFVSRQNPVIKNSFPGKTEKLLISFDIPEKQKKIRDWLRNQIKYWDFKMVHKSLWLGNGPLPKEFNQRLKHLKIDKYVKIFKVRKAA